MPAECAFTLPTGKKCRCTATRGHAFCRHHGAARSSRSPRESGLWSRRACWRDLGRSAATMPKEETAFEILQILHALGERLIADRTAGRLLRLLLARWDEVPLVPAPATGWVPGEPNPSSAPFSSPVQAAPPAVNAAMTPEQLERLVAQICGEPLQDLP